MAKSKAPVIDGARLDDIMSKIKGQAGRLASGDLDLAEAKSAVDNLRDAGVSMREVVLIDLAAISAADNWLAHEITEACKQVSKASNSKTSATFVSECKNVCHPRVRDRFTSLMAMRDELWPVVPDEVNVVNEACAKVWSRRYHMLTKMAQLVAKGEAVFLNADAVVNYATDNDPDHDAAKIQKRLDKIAETLAEFFVDFPHDDLSSAAELIGTIDVKKLQAARRELLGEDEPPTAVPTPAPKVQPVVKAVPTVVNIPAAQTPAPAAIQPASSIIADILGDDALEMAAA